MQQTSLPLATLLAGAQGQEDAARHMPASVHFGKRCITAFPSLYRHPEIRRTRDVLAASRQWTFDLSGVQFLVQWTGGRGGYWKFWAWSDAECVAAADSGSYYTPSAEVALCCFIGEALVAAQRDSAIVEVAA